jgi:hypothetical protein
MESLLLFSLLPPAITKHHAGMNCSPLNSQRWRSSHLISSPRQRSKSKSHAQSARGSSIPLHIYRHPNQGQGRSSFRVFKLAATFSLLLPLLILFSFTGKEGNRHQG